MTFNSIADALERAGHLFCLALAPSVFPPEPAASSDPVLGAFMSGVALGLVTLAAFRLRTKGLSRQTTLAAGLVMFAVAMAVAGGAGIRVAPLGRGVLPVAIPLWSGLALASWAVLRQRFSDEQKPMRTLVAVGMLALGFGQLAASATWLGSVERMWHVTLTRDGNAARAFAELTKSAADPRDTSLLRGVVDRCIATNPTSCACLSKRSELGRKANRLDDSLADARLAVALCPGRADAQVALVLALVSKGEGSQAEQAARATLEHSGQDPQMHYALALALEGQGRVQEAADSARRAVELGAGRDAQLLVAALAIVAGDLDAASNQLEKLVEASPNDAEARYDLALVADKKNDYNRAREGYLAALKADPTLVNARYNLALLTFRRGVVEEARHHARKFAEASPSDPRLPDLMRRLDATRPQRP